MENENVELNVVCGDGLGKRAAKRERSAGKIPAVLYAGGKESVRFCLDLADFSKKILLYSSSQVFSFVGDVPGVNGEKAIIKEIQVEPIKRTYLHVDFQKIIKGKTLVVTVPVEVKGEVKDVKNGVAIFQQRVYELDVECIPSLVPPKIEVDVSELNTGDSILAGDIEFSAGVRLKSSETTAVASVISANKAVISATASDDIHSENEMEKKTEEKL